MHPFPLLESQVSKACSFAYIKNNTHHAPMKDQRVKRWIRPYKDYTNKERGCQCAAYAEPKSFNFTVISSYGFI
jgi:hypothetical protein